MFQNTYAVAIMLHGDSHGCTSLTLTCQTLFTRVPILDYWSSFLRRAILYRAPDTIKPRLLLFTLCARHHTRVQGPRFYRSTFDDYL